MEVKKAKFGSIKEMLTKDQMKKIRGGDGKLYKCCTHGGGTCSSCVYSSTDSCPSGADLVWCG